MLLRLSCGAHRCGVTVLQFSCGPQQVPDPFGWEIERSTDSGATWGGIHFATSTTRNFFDPGAFGWFRMFAVDVTLTRISEYSTSLVL